MEPGSTITVGLQVAANDHKSKFLSEEEYAEMHGHIVNLPFLRDRIILRTGKLFIETGRKLTMTSLKHMHSMEEMT